MRDLKTVGLFVLFLVVAWPAAMPAETVSGTLKFFFTPVGNDPLRPRWPGPPFGPAARWAPGIDLYITHNSCRLHVESFIGGGAYFDNPDRFDLTFGGECLVKKWIVGVEFLNEFALNQTPLTDPDARRPDSAVNQTWIYGGRKFTFEKGSALIFYKHGLRGSLPLFAGDSGRPYVSQDIGSRLRLGFYEEWALLLDQDLYLTDEFSHGGLFLFPRLAVPVYHKIELVLGLRAYVNLGQQGHTNFFGGALRKAHGSLMVGLRLPFGEH